MRYRKLDADDDYSFGGGQTNFLRDTPEAVGQAVLTRLRLWVGEWFANTADGTGWSTQVLGRGTDLLYEQMIRDRILDTQGVTQIVSLTSQYDADARKISIQATIDTIYGQAAIEDDL